jgi:starch phosphorylase
MSATGSASRPKSARRRRPRFGAPEVLDPEAFTIGFARRFAAYKRPTLFRDVRRAAEAALTNPRPPGPDRGGRQGPPQGSPGPQMIREIVQLSRDPSFPSAWSLSKTTTCRWPASWCRVCDLWLNTPRRGEEACGTSGMKAGINGVLNLSVLDGWFDEAYEFSGGWAIGHRIPYSRTRTITPAPSTRCSRTRSSPPFSTGIRACLGNGSSE